VENTPPNTSKSAKVHDFWFGASFSSNPGSKSRKIDFLCFLGILGVFSVRNLSLKQVWNGLFSKIGCKYQELRIMKIERDKSVSNKLRCSKFENNPFHTCFKLKFLTEKDPKIPKNTKNRFFQDSEPRLLENEALNQRS